MGIFFRIIGDKYDIIKGLIYIYNMVKGKFRLKNFMAIENGRPISLWPFAAMNKKCRLRGRRPPAKGKDKDIESQA
jgi:hypothetical protein